MKVVHVLKKIEQIDEDVKELRKMQKSLHRNKAFAEPILMTIDKQINIMLGDRIKLLELTVANPPENIAKEFDSTPAEELKPIRQRDKKSASKKKSASAAKPRDKKIEADDDDDDAEIPMMTQDMLDSKFSAIKKTTESKEDKKDHSSKRDLLIKPHKDDYDDSDVKLTDVALVHGTLNKDLIAEEKKRQQEDSKSSMRVRFFKNNFPTND